MRRIFRNIFNFFKYKNVIERRVNKYKKREILKFKKQKNYKIGTKEIILIVVSLGILVYIHFSKYTLNSIFVGIFLFIGIIFYLLVVDRMIENKRIKQELDKMRIDKEKEYKDFLDKVKKIEEVEKNQIKEIILKNDEGYDIQKWEIGRKKELIIGKNTPRNEVDVDVSSEGYSNLVSRIHGSLRKIDGIWYYEDLGSQNGSGLEKKDDRRKIKLERNRAVKVEKGDIIYLPVTKILLK